MNKSNIRRAAAAAAAAAATTLVVSDEHSCFLLPSPSDPLPSSPLPIIPPDLVSSPDGIPKICFRGAGRPPPRRWQSWAKEMAGDAGLLQTWRDAGIDGAVAASAHAAIAPDRHAVEALCGFWCPATCTFLFPWGEAAFTLEDAHVLGGFPLSGSSLGRELTREEDRLRLWLLAEREKIREASAGRRVTCDVWLRWFSELTAADCELRHLGFLAYWLARDVVPPHPSGQIPAQAFALAARLSRGDRIGLAQAVTANIYRDLTKIASAILSRRAEGRVEVRSPFGLLQAWIWERFESLRPPSPRATPVSPTSTARIMRWSKRRRLTRREEAVRAFQDERGFTWRPYAKNPSGWKEPDWYSRENETILVEQGRLPGWFPDFLAVISPSVLISFLSDGIASSSEEYRPYRCGRQFGYDQAVPVSSNRARLSSKKIFIPSITRCGNARADYIPWWKQFMERCQEESAKVQKNISSFGTAKKHDAKKRKSDIAESLDVEGDRERHLVEELEEFVRSGLLNKEEGNSDGWCKIVDKYEDPYGGDEAIRTYPRFFELIPQSPHYRGLLDHATVSEGIKRNVYLAKWYRLVDLMRLALKTSPYTHSLEIEKMILEARKLEQLGFDVRHLIARLREPQARVERLEKARCRLGEAKRREREARDVRALSSHVSELESKVRSIEKKLDESRRAIGLKCGVNLEYLEKQVQAAEENLQLMERDAKIMSTKTEKPDK